MDEPEPPALPATSNWTMDVQFMPGPLLPYSVVMNVSSSTISGTLLQGGSSDIATSTFTGTLNGQTFIGTWVSSMGSQYVGAIEWTFNTTFDGIVSGNFWAANVSTDPYMFYLGAITGGTMLS